MISHVFLGVADFERALRFYSAVMDTLGYSIRFVDRTRPWAGWQQPGQDRPLFLIGSPFDERAHAPGNGQMIALLARDRATVDQAFSTALVNGGASEGEPGLRPHYHPDYYGAYFRDTEGNKLCVVHHNPGQAQ